MVLNSRSTDDGVNQTKKLTRAGNSLENFKPVPKIEKLSFEDIKVGDGSEVKLGDTITVDYTGAVASTGIVFESSLDSGQPATFALNAGGLIQGWVDGVPGMKVGGKRRLLIPAALAYGDQAQGESIPANSDLVFDIEVRSIGSPQ